MSITTYKNPKLPGWTDRTIRNKSLQPRSARFSTGVLPADSELLVLVYIMWNKLEGLACETRTGGAWPSGFDIADHEVHLRCSR